MQFLILLLTSLLNAERSVQNLLSKDVVCSVLVLLTVLFILLLYMICLTRSALQVPVAAVVIMACNRPDYLQRTVESILKYGSCLNHLS